MSTYPDVHELLQTIHANAAVHHGVNCDTTELAQQLGRPAQAVADLLWDPMRIGDHLTANVSWGGTTPYLYDIALTPNGLAAAIVPHSQVVGGAPAPDMERSLSIQST